MSNTVWANVELSNGTVQALGHWVVVIQPHRSGLTGLDRFRLPFPASRVVPTWCSHGATSGPYGMVGDSATPNVTELGIGIVDSITLNSDYSLSVEGDDLMREFANRNVHDLSLFDDYVRIADESRIWCGQ